MRSNGLLFAVAVGTFASGALFLACLDADGLDEGNGAGSNPGDATIVYVTGDGGAAFLADGACAANVQTDPRNCGQCGHVCGASASPSASASDGGSGGGVVSTAFACNAGQCVSTCDPGYGDCNGSASDGCESTLATDPNNCGACAHACGGGACTAGQCQPTTLATLAGGTVQGIVVDDRNIYFSTTGAAALWSLPKAGGAAIQLSDAGLAPTSITQVADRLYIGDPVIPSVSSVLVDGGGLQTLAPTEDVVTIGTNGSRVFWAHPMPIPRVWAYDSDAGVVVLYEQAESPYHLAANNSAVYSLGQGWLDAVPPAGTLTNDTVYRCSLPTCQADAGTFAVAQSRTYAIATDGINVYWTAQNTGSGDGFVAYCPVDACPANGPRILTSALAEPTDMVADGTSVFWVESTNGTIRSFPAPQTTATTTPIVPPVGSADASLDAGSPPVVIVPAVKTVASGLRDAAHLAVDDMYVYWTVGSGTFQRVRK